MPAIRRRHFLKSCALASGVTVIPSRLVCAQSKSAATNYGVDEGRAVSCVQTKTDGTIAKYGLHWTLPRYGISYLRCFD